jgi:SNF2 family DNA or RNA helicase
MSKPFKPHGYQLQMIDHIVARARCALWVFMGGGKSVATLTALDALSMAEDDVYPALVLAPLRVAKTTWPEEVLKWDHLARVRVVPIVGSASERVAALRTAADVYTCNYENLPWLTEYWGDRWPYKTIVLDEATKVKSFRLRQGGKRSQALGKVAHRKAKRLIELSGTPAPNGLKDLWGQIWFLDIGERLGRTYDAFKQRWFQRSFDGHGIDPLDHAQAEIQDKLRDVCLTVKAEDWFDLKAPITQTIYVDLPMKARKHYAELEKDMFTQLAEHAVEAFGAAERTMKCLQLASGALYTAKDEWEVLHDGKIEALESIVEEWNGEPVLVAYHFKSDLARLKKAFPKARHLDSNPKTIAQWNAGEIPLLLAHPQSAGHGLNLQYGGRVLVYFSHWWALEDRLQIAERIGPVRQLQAGLDRSVFIYNIVARDTVDELVIARNDEKFSVQEVLLNAMKLRKIQ